MAYEQTAAAINHAALIDSSRTSAMTPQATAPTMATADQIAIDLVLTVCSSPSAGGGLLPGLSAN